MAFDAIPCFRDEQKIPWKIIWIIFFLNSRFRHAFIRIHEISVDFCFLDDIFREWDKRIKQEFGYAKYYGVFGLQNLSDRQFFIVVFIVISCIASAAFEFTK